MGGRPQSKAQALAGRHGVHILARVKPEKRDEFVQLITQLIRDVHANEPDTIYEVMQTQDPNAFVFFQRFPDEAAWQRHQDSPYHTAMSAAGWACLDGEPVIETLKPLEA